MMYYESAVFWVSKERASNSGVDSADGVNSWKKEWCSRISLREKQGNNEMEISGWKTEIKQLKSRTR